MDFPSSLHDQQINSKKKPLFRIGFLFLFAVSLGLNFYLIFFDGKSSVEIAKVILPKEESINLGYLTADEFDAWVRPEDMCGSLK